MELARFLEKNLGQVERPARYIGGEVNACSRDPQTVAVRWVLAYPDLYDIGASNLGLQVLYETINLREDAMAERVYLPWHDMQERMRAAGVPLFSLESRRPVADCEILGITLQHELTYANVIRLLDLAGIPRRASDRGPEYPLVVAGGPGCFNPEPLADVFDVMVVGNGERAAGRITDILAEGKSRPRADLLRELAREPGCYVPSLYRPRYDAAGAFDGMRPEPGAPERVTAEVLGDLDSSPLPSRPVMPYLEAVHDRASIEVFRGCTRGCRFCQAGFTSRPVRERGVPMLREWARRLLANTGYGELSLSSLNTPDHSAIRELVLALREDLEGTHTRLSLPSLRCDIASVELAALTREARRSGLTFAPEAGSQRMRDGINKGVREEDIIETLEFAVARGWKRAKLYFMLGLPGERDEDVVAIAELARMLLARPGLRQLQLTLSVSCFVPKAQTPFQWAAQASPEELLRRQSLLRQALPRKNVSFNWHGAEASYLEGLLARGDRRLLPVIERASESGCFDNWSESFDYERWERAWQGMEPAPAHYVERERDPAEKLPWEHIDCRVAKSYLLQEYERSRSGAITPDCRADACGDCGACPGGGLS
ncbi:MAG: TIGR03960 family B12-binding radical SAM protein [Candidatus Geothermincolia bacterium]